MKWIVVLVFVSVQGRTQVNGYENYLCNSVISDYQRRADTLQRFYRQAVSAAEDYYRGLFASQFANDFDLKKYSEKFALDYSIVVCAFSWARGKSAFLERP